MKTPPLSLALGSLVLLASCSAMWQESTISGFPVTSTSQKWEPFSTEIDQLVRQNYGANTVRWGMAQDDWVLVRNRSTGLVTRREARLYAGVKGSTCRVHYMVIEQASVHAEWSGLHVRLETNANGSPRSRRIECDVLADTTRTSSEIVLD
jgi:hypothetical protein